MKAVKLFIQPRCPFCVKALKYIAEAKASNADLAEIEIEVIDELKEPELADQYDYYYVPTLYIDGVKVHEGAIYAEEMESLLRKAL